MIGLKYIFLFNIGILVSAYPTNVGIVGGHKADIKDHPWVVSVLIDLGGEQIFICTGFLISPKWAVTAATCIDSDYEMVIGVGTNYSFYNKINKVKVEYFVRHPEFKATIDNNPINDIALLRLLNPVDDPIAKPVALPEPLAEIKPTTEINITGFGIVEGGQYPGELYTITLQVISLDDCIDAFKGSSLFINETFCVGKFHENKGICNGDSGAPAVVNGVIGGIASYTWNRCADNGFPSVFTNISYYRDWIYDHTNV